MSPHNATKLVAIIFNLAQNIRLERSYIMRGHVRKRGKKWAIVVDIGYDENGKRKQKWFSGYNTKKEAEKDLANIINKVENGQLSDTKNMCVKEYLEHWLEEYAKNNVSHTTFEKYQYSVKKAIPYIGHLKLTNLKPLHIQKLFNDLSKTGLSSSSCAAYYRALNTALNMAVKWQIISNNPCSSINSPKENNKKMNVLTQNEVNYLLGQIKDRPIYPVVLLAVSCGLRRGEILGLQWANIDFINSTLYIENNLTQSSSKIELGETKTSTGKRAVALPNSVLKELKEIRKQQKENKLMLGQDYEDNDYVCTWPDGKIFRPDYITKAFPKLLKEFDLPQVRFHDLRHTHATLLLRQGIHPKVVQERLGHSNISITLDTYSHILPDMQKEAADKIDGILSV